MVCLSVILLCYRIACLWFCNRRFCNKKAALFVLDPVYLLFSLNSDIKNYSIWSFARTFIYTGDKGAWYKLLGIECQILVIHIPPDIAPLPLSLVSALGNLPLATVTFLGGRQSNLSLTKDWRTLCLNWINNYRKINVV